MASFFLFRCGFQEKTEPSWRNYLIWTVEWGGEHNIPNTQNRLIIFLSAVEIMQVMFWTEYNFRFFSDCKNSVNCKLKKLINEQIIISYRSSDALSADKNEFTQIKTRYFNSFTISSQSKLKNIQHTILETFSKKNLTQNLTRFHGELFEFESLEILETAFLLKTIIWTWIFSSTEECSP